MLSLTGRMCAICLAWAQQKETFVIWLRPISIDSGDRNVYFNNKWGHCTSAASRLITLNTVLSSHILFNEELKVAVVAKVEEGEQANEDQARPLVQVVTVVVCCLGRSRRIVYSRPLQYQNVVDFSMFASSSDEGRHGKFRHGTGREEHAHQHVRGHGAQASINGTAGLKTEEKNFMT